MPVTTHWTAVAQFNDDPEGDLVSSMQITDAYLLK